MQGSHEDWQAQVEELVALQSIYFDGCFRLLGSLLGQPTNDDGASNSAHTADASSTEPAEASVSSEELLQSMLGQPRPATMPPPLRLEVLTEVELPSSGLQITLGRGAPSSQRGGTDTAAPSGSSEDVDGGSGVGEGPCNGGCSSAADGGGSPGGMPVGELVRWLPPLRVAFELPSDYPSGSPPIAMVSAGWLEAGQLQQLERGLETVWHEQGEGFPVLFAYLDWLKESSLQHLGISGTLHLQGSGSSGGAAVSSSGGDGEGRSKACEHEGGQKEQECSSGDACEMPAALSAEQVAMQLLRYHAAKEQEEFDSSQQRCVVCFEEHMGSACMRLPACRHHYCRACLQQLCSTNVKAGSVEALRCPDPGCRLPLPPHVLQALLTKEEFDRWESLLLQRTLDRMQDLVWCPRCECPCIEDPDHFAQCASCLYAFCSMCQDSWHPGTQCMTDEQRVMILERRRARGGAGAKDTRAEMDLVQQLASLKVLKETSRPCPTCKFPIEKTEGCNKMTCTYCNSFWCWRCGEVITGYDHFKDNAHCALFEQAEIDRWNAMFAAERVRDQQHAAARPLVRLMAPGVPVTHCPSCGQENVQVNRNNLVRCWACASHYCAACRKPLRGRVGQHFLGAGGCKQHA